jgi:hypothetical protein
MGPDARDLWERLFAISGTQGKYPQFFAVTSTSSLGDGGSGGNSDGSRLDIIEYFGDFDRMEMLNKTSGLPPEVLATNPKFHQIPFPLLSIGIRTKQEPGRENCPRGGGGGQQQGH